MNNNRPNNIPEAIFKGIGEGAQGSEPIIGSMANLADAIYGAKRGITGGWRANTQDKNLKRVKQFSGRGDADSEYLSDPKNLEWLRKVALASGVELSDDQLREFIKERRNGEYQEAWNKTYGNEARKLMEALGVEQLTDEQRGQVEKDVDKRNAEKAKADKNKKDLARAMQQKKLGIPMDADAQAAYDKKVARDKREEKTKQQQEWNKKYGNAAAALMASLGVKKLNAEQIRQVEEFVNKENEKKAEKKRQDKAYARYQQQTKLGVTPDKEAQNEFNRRNGIPDGLIPTTPINKNKNKNKIKPVSPMTEKTPDGSEGDKPPAPIEPKVAVPPSGSKPKKPVNPITLTGGGK